MKKKTKYVIIAASAIFIGLFVLFWPTITADGQDEIRTVTGSASFGTMKADFKGNIHQNTITGIITQGHYNVPVTIYLKNLPPTFSGVAMFEGNAYSISGMYIRLGSSISGIWNVKGFSGSLSLDII